MATQQSSALARDAGRIDELARMCKALGHPARVRLLKHLIDYGTCFFGNLSEVVPLAASTVSQHMAVLKAAGLVIGSADEHRTCYCVNPDRIAFLKHLVQEL